MPTTAAELLVKVSADTAQAEAALRRFSSQMAGGGKGGIFGAVFGGNVASDMFRGATRAVGGLARGVVGIGMDAISSGADFSFAMDQVTAVLGGTEAEAQRLNDTALALGMNPNLKVGVDEVAAGMYTLATAGITADQIIGGAMESTILLGNAAGASMDQSAEVTTKAMSIFKLGASDLGNVVDGAVGVLNASTYSLEDYAYFVANAGGTAAALGLSIDEMNQAAVVMAPSFSTGRTAATSFDAMLKGLSPTTAAAKDAMAALGMTTEDGANIFFDAAGDVVAFDDIYRNLVRTMGGLDAKTQMDMASAIFGEAGGAAAIALIRTTGDEYTRLQKIVGDTDALQQATIRTDNLNSKWDTFKDSIQSVKIAAFDAVKVPLTMAFEALMPAVSFLGPIVIGWAEQAGAWLETNIPILQARIPIAFEAWNNAPGLISGVAAAYGELSGKAGELKPVVDDLSAMDEALQAFSTTGANPFPAFFAGIAASMTGGTAEFDAATGTLTAKWAAFQVEMSKTGTIKITVDWEVVLGPMSQGGPVAAGRQAREAIIAAFSKTVVVKQGVEVQVSPAGQTLENMSKTMAGWLNDTSADLGTLLVTAPIEVTPQPSLAGAAISDFGSWLKEQLSFDTETPYEVQVKPWIDIGSWGTFLQSIGIGAGAPMTIDMPINPTVKPVSEWGLPDAIDVKLAWKWASVWIKDYIVPVNLDWSWKSIWQMAYALPVILRWAWASIWLKAYSVAVSLIPTWAAPTNGPPGGVPSAIPGLGDGLPDNTGGNSGSPYDPQIPSYGGIFSGQSYGRELATSVARGPQVVINASVADAIDMEVLARRIGQYLRMG